MSTALVAGSIASVAAREGLSLAESILNASHLVLVDVSYSMSDHDSRGGRSRHSVAQEELNKLQQSHPGDIAVAAFSDSVEFCPSGVLPPPLSGTNLAGALSWAKQFDGCMTIVVISDGEPDDPAGALAIAATFTSRIDCVFVGCEADRASRDFMRRLASAGHGQSVLAEKATELAERVETLLLGAGK